MTMESDRCSVCGNTRQWHKNNSPRHAFIEPGGNPEIKVMGEPEPSTEDSPQRGIRPMRTPFDPILRQALIDKGVLTIQDLEEAERKVRFLSQDLGGTTHG